MSEMSYAAWIGRTQESQEELSTLLVSRLAATLGEPAPAAGEALPPLWHWAFFQDAVPEAGLGADGHPARGGFLPPADGRNRMWAGGRLEFHEPLLVGHEASRVTTILKVEEKHGRTGALLFVTLRHDYLQEGRLALREEQDIVYREPSPPKLGGTEALPEGAWREAVEPSPVLLFRYSAVTFNGHRIHYDWPYVTGAEGYPGLVVHGPLIATLNLRAFCRANPQARLRRFAYRGLRPLICPEPFELGGRPSGPGKAEVWAGNAAGIAQRGEVEFD
ncbi:MULTISPECIES: MaoC family dehydratase N-terminal domain-containing protein [unclassified Pseudomonas]|uniref:FAS1-like dehydratase domain-containing protein n=1 Tax=unclassified Pseudomonas TaxID=196821 RepID=UPI00072FA97B|nr:MULTISPECIES: MaoC family dehydratase N-terminal domain-containing protein [unclassified Pseudomonas]KSW27937.1 transposase [Pseudomonas sp. ADP]OBP07435.1 transposase [Pseudomonas sp. EGD-AKN5]QOF84608.1 MaoC family dehydratase N-terminal domain-containing protein [Pseudomonas sp. ADPe]